MDKWYFRIGENGFIIPPPDKELQVELYPTSDLIRLANYDMVGRFVGCAMKMTFAYDKILHSMYMDIFREIMGWNAQNSWLIGNRALHYRFGRELRKMECYTGAIDTSFLSNFMGAESDNWIWRDLGFSLIQKNMVGGNQLYALDDGTGTLPP